MFAKLKESAVAIVIGALLIAGSYIAWDNHVDQKTEIQRLNEVIAVKDGKIQELNANASKDVAYKDAGEKVDSKLVETTQKASEQVTEAKRYVDKRLAEIDKKYAKLPKDDESSRAKSIEISLEQARGMWAVYCIQVPRDPACK